MSPDILMQIVFMVGGAALGTLFSLLTPPLYTLARHRKRGDLRGVWKSRYQDEFHSPGKWIDEEVEIELGRKGVEILNRGNQQSATYKATGKLRHHDSEIIGEWHETSPGAHARGSFHIFLHPGGHVLYGICSDVGPAGERLYTGWILARKEADLAVAQQLLCKADLVRMLSQPNDGQRAMN